MVASLLNNSATIKPPTGPAKRFSVLAFFHDNFVVNDIFDSDKNPPSCHSAALLLAASSAEDPGQLALL